MAAPKQVQSYSEITSSASIVEYVRNYGLSMKKLRLEYTNPAKLPFFEYGDRKILEVSSGKI